MRYSSGFFTLIGAYMLAQTAAAVSLEDFTPRVSNLVGQCQKVYTSTISGCTSSDFSGGTCSKECLAGLKAIGNDVLGYCATSGITGDNIVADFLSGTGLSNLCNNADSASTIAPSATSSSSSSSTTSPSTTSATSTSEPTIGGTIILTSATNSVNGILVDAPTSSAPLMASATKIAGTMSTVVTAAGKTTTDGIIAQKTSASSESVSSGAQSSSKATSTSNSEKSQETNSSPFSSSSSSSSGSSSGAASHQSVSYMLAAGPALLLGSFLLIR